MNKILPFLLITSIAVVFFWQFFIKGLLPIPSDTIIGLYHPFRDLYAKDYPNGVPFKNFLITDPVRQQYPWRKLSIDLIKKMELPLWNPYSFGGTPLLANFQSAPFYFVNILFLILPFNIGWSLSIFLGSLLGGIFLYLYLNNLKLDKWSSMLGGFVFAFCGFFVAWMEWGTITHVVLWLPLLLLAIDKIISSIKHQALSVRDKKVLFWSLVYVFSLISSFFAGHLQIFFYVFIVSFIYLILRFIQYKKLKTLLLFAICYLIFVIVTVVQWFPTLQFIQLSARDIDQISYQKEGWFIPWQHLVQFVAPDFFGNPTTLNYWGVWNYAELIGYIGIAPLILALFALFFRRDRKTLFFGTMFFISLIFCLPTIFAKLPFILNIPLLSTAQPTRLLFIIDFSLSVLAALGMDYFLKFRRKTILYPIGFILVVFLGLWVFVSLGNILVAKRNLIFPSIIFLISAMTFFSFFLNRLAKHLITVILIALFGITILDLFRFGWKFLPFTPKEYLFPNTKTISFLSKSLGNYRYMTTDPRILPPNFSSFYKLSSIDGYDPLYLRSFGELIASSERGKPDISPPFGFNRIITPQRYDSNIIDLLGIKYVLSLSELKSEKLKKVFQEGKTIVYENKGVLPRAFFVEKIIYEKDKDHIISRFFEGDIDLSKIAILPRSQTVVKQLGRKRTIGSAEILHYSENRVLIEVKNPDNAGFLILTDSYYPTWRAKIDNDYETPILQVDYNFRGINVPEGQHVIEFYNSLL